MAYFFKQFIFGVLVLVVASSPVQSIIAFDIDQGQQEMRMDCRQALIQSPEVGDRQAPECCQSSQENACVNKMHVGCVAQFSPFMFLNHFSLVVSAGVARGIDFNFVKHAVRTHYPERIIRPPRA